MTKGLITPQQSLETRGTASADTCAQTSCHTVPATSTMVQETSTYAEPVAFDASGD